MPVSWESSVQQASVHLVACMTRACQQTVPSKAVVQSDKRVIESGTPTTCRIYRRSQAHETVYKRKVPESIGCVGVAVETMRSDT